MFRCTTDNYDTIYEPWLTEPDELLRLGEYTPGEHLIDLCGGTGVVSRAALHIGEVDRVSKSNIFLLDLNPRCKDTRVFQLRASAESVGELEARSQDIVVCRQAMGYLNPKKVIPGVAFILKPGGRFVFNTFLRPGWFRKKSYTYNGVWFFEAHLVLFGRIFHVQYRNGGGWDVSVFKYHESEYLTRLLTPYFKVEVQSHGRGLHWLCTRLTEKAP